MSDESHIENVSDTALWVAMFRAREGQRADALFKDPLAEVLAGERGKRLAATLPFKKLLTWVMVVRTVAIDRLIMTRVHEGVDTVINLGAGLDTRPYRLDLPKQLRWIEIDFANIIEMKNRLLSEHAPVCQLERHALDLGQDGALKNLLSGLVAGSKKSLVLTEGVIPYLSNQEVDQLSHALLVLPQVVYWVQDFYEDMYAFGDARGWRKVLNKAPVRFKTHHWMNYFFERGWRAHETVHVADEAMRIGRPFPFIFPLSLGFWLMSQKKKEKMRQATGYVVLSRKE